MAPVRAVGAREVFGELQRRVQTEREQNMAFQRSVANIWRASRAHDSAASDTPTLKRKAARARADDEPSDGGEAARDAAGGARHGATPHGASDMLTIGAARFAIAAAPHDRARAEHALGDAARDDAHHRRRSGATLDGGEEAAGPDGEHADAQQRCFPAFAPDSPSAPPPRRPSATAGANENGPQHRARAPSADTRESRKGTALDEALRAERARTRELELRCHAATTDASAARDALALVAAERDAERRRAARAASDADEERRRAQLLEEDAGRWCALHATASERAEGAERGAAAELSLIHI